jgi:HlyD family secretion protein
VADEVGIPSKSKSDAAVFPILKSIRWHLFWSGFAILILFGGLGGWAVATELSGAIVATGQLVVHSNVKKVQHPTGGVIGELRVRDGDRVAEGDVVARLADTATKANLAILVNSLNELYARRTRLEAEHSQSAEMLLPKEFEGKPRDPAIVQVFEAAETQFRVRREAREGQKSQLRQRVTRHQDEIAGLTAQIAAKKKELNFHNNELGPLRELWKNKLIDIQRVTQLEREAARLEGELGHLAAAVAQAKGSIDEIELQIMQIDQDLRAEVSKELGETQEKINELTERKLAAEDQLERIQIRAPQDGIVYQLAVHTVGAVVGAGDEIMLIVPEGDNLAVEAKISPTDIDQVHIGQTAILRLSAFNQVTTPETTGRVMFISPDLLIDQRSGMGSYTIRILVDTKKAGNVTLLPGMPVEAFIQTGSRSVLSYLIKPMSDQIARAFREN